MNNKDSDVSLDAFPWRRRARFMSSEQTDPAFAALDYRNYDFTWEQAVRVLRKNQRIGMAFCGLLIALTLLVVICMKDVYQPVARIEIAPPTSGIRTLHEIESPPEVEYQDYLETETQILQSDALAVSVIRQLRLDKNSAFMGRQAGTGSAPIAPEDSNAPPGRGKAFLQEQIALATLTPSESEALDKFRQNLSVNIIRNTRLVEVSFASHDPDIARQIANEVIATFIQNDYKRRYDTTTQASEWLSSQLN